MERKYKRWTQSHFTEFIEMWQSGATREEIAEKFEMCVSYVVVKASQLRKKGIKLENRRKAIKINWSKLKKLTK